MILYFSVTFHSELLLHVYGSQESFFFLFTNIHKINVKEMHNLLLQCLFSSCPPVFIFVPAMLAKTVKIAGRKEAHICFLSVFFI